MLSAERTRRDKIVSACGRRRESVVREAYGSDANDERASRLENRGARMLLGGGRTEGDHGRKSKGTMKDKESRIALV